MSPRPSTLAALAHALGISIDYLVDGSMPRTRMLDHSVFPYRDDDRFQAAIGSFLAEGIERSEGVVVATTPANIELLRESLGKEAGKVEFVDSSVFYSSPLAALDAVKAFSDAELARGAPWVRFLGEPVWEGRSAAEVRLWTRYESLFNLVFATSPMTVVCPYDERSVTPAIVHEAQLTHPHTMGGRELSKNPEYTDPERFALGQYLNHQVFIAMNNLEKELLELGGGDITTALDEMPLPAALLDPAGVIRWQNRAAIALRGKRVGVELSELVACTSGPRSARPSTASFLKERQRSSTSMSVTRPNLQQGPGKRGPGSRRQQCRRGLRSRPNCRRGGLDSSGVRQRPHQTAGRGSAVAWRRVGRPTRSRRTCR